MELKFVVLRGNVSTTVRQIDGKKNLGNHLWSPEGECHQVKFLKQSQWAVLLHMLYRDVYQE